MFHPVRRATGALAVAAVIALALPIQAHADPGPTKRYIVKTVSSAAATSSANNVETAGGDVRTRYTKVFSGFSASMTQAAAQALASNAQVVSVTEDAPTRASAVQTNPPWGLDRIDQRFTAGDAKYNYTTTGRNVTAFIVDTGIRFSHAEFGGRATSGYDFVDLDNDASDCAGHGTHVAGTVGGSTYGVAKDIKFVSLRVWGCNSSGWFSDMISAMDWIIAHKPAGPAVVNISGGGSAYSLMDDAVSRTVSAGIPVVVAAGNGYGDACDFSPARTPDAVTVAATDVTDTRASFSNFGNCVDLFAPGVDVLSAYSSSDTATANYSGTSMATPHVAGLVARRLQREPSLTPSGVVQQLRSHATLGVVQDAQGSPNYFAYGPPQEGAPPEAPLNVAATKDDGSSSATLTWTPPADPGTSPITGYKVSRDGTDNRGNGTFSTTVTADKRSQSFVWLNRATTYTFSVQAISSAGAGPVVSAKVSMAAGPPTVPVAVTATKSDAAATATLSWSPPIDNGGAAITGYKISRDGTDNRGNGTWTSTLTADKRSQVFSWLRGQNTYNLSVQAITGNGTGPAATVKVTMGTTPLSPPLNVASSKSDAAATATLTWSPPSDSGGSPTGYKVSRDGTDNRGNAAWSTTVAADQRSQTFAWLRGQNAYNLSVQAITANGTGPATTVKVTMGTTPLSPPLGVSASKDDSTSTATLTWIPPSDTGGVAITGYKVGRDGIDNRGNGAFSTTVTADKRSQSFVWLKRGTNYNLSVQAITANGTGPATTVKVTMAP